ncbi:DUF4190 domain-containing protein [Demequina pelophila]|uniref:DUF4190 domain-containing protein n=1 Tax=Demequina pelophila TaxID=1638984 RepID=UPI00078525DA|nr:DUF4190 domain-containing protein [Demequina pelophila]
MSDQRPDNADDPYRSPEAQQPPQPQQPPQGDPYAAPQGQYAQPQYGQPQPAQPGQPQYAQQPYGQQPGYPPQAAPAQYATTKPRTWMNVVSLVTSLLGIGLAGVIFGHLGVSAANKGEADYKGLGIAGLILGYLQILLGIAFLIFAVIAVTSCANDPACTDWWNSITVETS